MSYNVVIAEDEELSADLLKAILYEINDIAGPFEILSISHSGEDAIAAVKNHKPDILFLDINMPHGDGFSVVEALKNLPHSPAIIFTTAHSRFAVQAFDVEAVDYLLKPLSNERVIQAINRIKKSSTAIEAIQPTIIKVPLKNGAEFISSTDIDAMEASGDYIYIHVHNRKLMIRGSLRDYTEKLKPIFYQSHRSFLINLSSVVSIERNIKGGSSAILSSGLIIPISRRYRAGMIKLLPDMI